MKNQGNFQDQVMKAVLEVVKTHQHEHPMYRPTSAERCIIDEKKGRAAFVLFEQIDTDRGSPDASGWLGDQYRYSLWHVKEGEQPKQLYEDHAWIRNSVSTLTGTKGRDCEISIDSLVEDGVIAHITPKEQRGGTYSKTKVKITLAGSIEEPDDFLDQARNLVKRAGPSLGYDHLSQLRRLEGKDIAAIVWSCENGTTYGYDTLYLVWKDEKGLLRYNAIKDTQHTKDYISLGSIIEKENVVLKYQEHDEFRKEDKVRLSQVTLDRIAECSEGFDEQAKELVKQEGEIEIYKRIDGKDAAVISWKIPFEIDGLRTSYDLVFLVWKDKDAKIQVEKLIDHTPHFSFPPGPWGWCTYSSVRIESVDVQKRVIVETGKYPMDVTDYMK